MAGSAGMTLYSINPANGREFGRFEGHTPAETDRRLAAAAAAFGSFFRTTFADRAGWMRRVADDLTERRDELARLITLEMGKPLRAAAQEVEKCALACRFYADKAAAYLADEPVPAETGRMWVRHQPLGPVLAVMPWNFPFWQVFRFAAPALMAGNTGLLKHASNVPQCALAIEDVFRRAGFPDGVFQTLLIGPAAVEGVIADARVAAVTLTGSVAAGASVAAAAGRHIKKTVLELGGSDPFIVLPGADLGRAVEAAVTARTINNGQSCIAAKRFILHQAVAESFERRFIERMAGLRVGDPMDPATDIGPLATRQVRDDVDRQVRETVRQGAECLLGGEVPTGDGFFYPPTVLTRIPPGSPAAQDEIFGPVAALFRARDLAEAIGLANDTPFGLGASAWTTDPDEQACLIENLQAGAVFINGMVVSDPRMPFGGIKLSGYGRELSSHGIREFVNVKSVVIR